MQNPIATHLNDASASRTGGRIRLRERLRARVMSYSLDRALAAGVPEDSSPALELRAQRLTNASAATELGGQLRRIITEAHEPGPPSMRIRPCTEQVLAVEEDLRRLASRLQSPRPATAGGIARVRLLLIDGTGPLYHSGGNRSLGALVNDAAAALG
jgi:hypothetical protein